VSEETKTATHTPGMLEIRFSNEYGGFTLAEKGGRGVVCEYWPPAPDEHGAANARRLAACWNACEGIPTKALEARVVGDLLAACRLALACEQREPDHDYAAMREALETAIAKAQGAK
jgi:hypothetical protein